MTSSAITVPDEVQTPAVLVDIDRLDRNIRGWAEHMQTRNVGMRPHTKTSKCLPIIKRQVEAGVIGLTVATLAEAEILADAGYNRLFQAYPLWAGHPARARRLRDLAERVDLMVGVESVVAADALGRAMSGAASTLAVAVEIDPGLGRSGVEPAEVVAIARAAGDAGLEVRGAFTFGGHAYADCDAPPGAADDEVEVLVQARDLLDKAGFSTEVLSAGSTPTARTSARPPVTDERPGTYVFHDAQQVTLGVADMSEVALMVAATVVAVHRDGRFVLDSGSKVLASDRPSWMAGFGLLPDYPEAQITSLSEHHAVVNIAGPVPVVGDVVAVVPNHCCVVVNLVDELTIVRDGLVVDRWPVVGRGRNT